MKCFIYTTKIDTSVFVCHGSLNCSLMTCSQVLDFDLHVFHESLMQQYRTMFFLKPHYAPGDRVCPYNAYTMKMTKEWSWGHACLTFTSCCGKWPFMLLCIYLFSFASSCFVVLRCFSKQFVLHIHLFWFFKKQFCSVKWTGLN